MCVISRLLRTCVFDLIASRVSSHYAVRGSLSDSWVKVCPTSLIIKLVRPPSSYSRRSVNSTPAIISRFSIATPCVEAASPSSNSELCASQRHMVHARCHQPATQNAKHLNLKSRLNTR